MVDPGAPATTAVRADPEASTDIAPSDLAAFVAERARGIGGSAAVVYLVDYALANLMPLPGAAALDRAPLPIDGTVAGRAFTSGEAVIADGGATASRIWAPVHDGALRLGVVEVMFEQAPGGPEIFAACELLGRDLAASILVKERYGDVFAFIRRPRPMTVAAEMQWALLPPTSFASQRVAISGMLQPALTVAGDAFDYAVDGATAHLAVLDAMGHGLASAMLSAVAVGAYRNARRTALSLVETLEHMEHSLVTVGERSRFVTALLMEIDIDSGLVTWCSAGHPPALLLRDRHMIDTLWVEPSPPLGLGLLGDISVASRSLQPEDSVLIYSDGITESRRGNGQMFGVDRLADFITRETAAGLSTPETLRRLAHAILDFQHGDLQDDATVLMATWRP